MSSFVVVFPKESIVMCDVGLATFNQNALPSWDWKLWHKPLLYRIDETTL
jgi:hypothetical protein